MFLSDLLVAAQNVKLNPFPVWHAVDKKTDLSFVLKASEGIRTVVGSVWTVASWLCLLLCRDLSLFVLCPLWLDWFNQCGTCWRSVSGVLFVCSEEDGGAEVRFQELQSCDQKLNKERKWSFKRLWSTSESDSLSCRRAKDRAPSVQAETTNNISAASAILGLWLQEESGKKVLVPRLNVCGLVVQHKQIYPVCGRIKESTEPNRHVTGTENDFLIKDQRLFILHLNPGSNSSLI